MDGKSREGRFGGTMAMRVPYPKLLGHTLIFGSGRAASQKVPLQIIRCQAVAPKVKRSVVVTFISDLILEMVAVRSGKDT